MPKKVVFENVKTIPDNLHEAIYQLKINTNEVLDPKRLKEFQHFCNTLFDDLTENEIIYDAHYPDNSDIDIEIVVPTTERGEVKHRDHCHISIKFTYTDDYKTTGKIRRKPRVDYRSVEKSALRQKIKYYYPKAHINVVRMSSSFYWNKYRVKDL